MLLVKTRIGLSDISGLGLFADEFIKKDTVIWKFTNGVDVRLSDEQLAAVGKEHPLRDLEKYMYRSKVSAQHILCSDDARFINHSSKPNTIETQEDIEGYTIASADIQPGEEITSDYSGFDVDFEQYREMLT